MRSWAGEGGLRGETGCGEGIRGRRRLERGEGRAEKLHTWTLCACDGSRAWGGWAGAPSACAGAGAPNACAGTAWRRLGVHISRGLDVAAPVREALDQS